MLVDKPPQRLVGKLNGTSVLKNLKLYNFETISDVQE